MSTIVSIPRSGAPVLDLARDEGVSSGLITTMSGRECLTVGPRPQDQHGSGKAQCHPFERGQA
jgi:hypothetical protein